MLLDEGTTTRYNTLLIIVGHGPEDGSDNGPDLKTLQPHVERLKARKEYADVRPGSGDQQRGRLRLLIA